MQDAPDKTVLLGAIAKFLAESVVPAIDDRALSFRVRIAAHTLGGLMREVHGEENLDASELAALTGDDPIDMPASARKAAIRAARQAVVHQIRDPDTSETELAHLRAVLRNLEGAKAILGQPRFDLSDRIEP